MVYKQAEPKGIAQEQGLFMAINLCLLWFIYYILHSDWSY